MPLTTVWVDCKLKHSSTERLPENWECPPHAPFAITTKYSPLPTHFSCGSKSGMWNAKFPQPFLRSVCPPDLMCYKLHSAIAILPALMSHQIACVCMSPPSRRARQQWKWLPLHQLLSLLLQLRCWDNDKMEACTLPPASPRRSPNTLLPQESEEVMPHPLEPIRSHWDVIITLGMAARPYA